MKLADLPSVAEHIAPTFHTLSFKRLILDSRALMPGDVFIALQGQQNGLVGGVKRLHG